VPSGSHGSISRDTELRATVRGYVQGVGFRYFVLRRAHALNLNGYVRNAEDGNVEVVARGTRDALDQLAAELYIGPSESEVNSVDLAWGPARETYQGFEIRY
jgi:acylphosphatase